VARRHAASEGAWNNYYLPDGSVEDIKLDSNVCAYVATGRVAPLALHVGRAFVDHLWPTVDRALEWVLSLRRNDGTILWACEPEAKPWDYALLTGSSSIMHSLHCGAKLAELINEPRPQWSAAAVVLARSSPAATTPRSNPSPAGRWTGTTRCSPAR